MYKGREKQGIAEWQHASNQINRKLNRKINHNGTGTKLITTYLSPI